MKKTVKKNAFIAASLLILASYSCFAGTSTQVEYGVVETVRISSAESKGQRARPLRTAGAAVLGATLGNQIGGGSGKTIATVAGGVAAAEVSRSRQDTELKQESVELDIKVDGGKRISVVQEHNGGITFSRGDRVRIRTTGSDTVVDKG